MIIRKLLGLFSVLAAVSACTALQENEEITQAGRPERFRVSLEAASGSDSGQPTKTFLNSNGKIRWNEDDRLSVFNMTSFNRQYKFTGTDGASSGSIEKVGTVFNTGEDISYVYAVYPYSAANSIGEEDEVLSLAFPAEQTWLEASFGRGANIMVSVSDGVDDRLFFKNVGGYLMLKFYGAGVYVSSIELSGNIGEPLSGEAKVTASMDGNPSARMTSSASTSVKLLCDPPVALGPDAENYTSFYLVLPPTTFERGFTVTVLGEGGSFVKTSSKTLEVPRNTIVSMVPLEVSLD